jgi:dCMP deaminase
LSESRLGWDAYFLRIASIVAERSTCLRAKVGAVIVRDRNIIATGYNGSPAGLPHCLDAGCLLTTSTDPDGNVEENCFRTIHAEINAIAQAAKHGSMIAGADIYVTHSPCLHCLKVLLNVGLQRICYAKPYKIDRAEALVRGLPARLVRIDTA